MADAQFKRPLAAQIEVSRGAIGPSLLRYMCRGVSFAKKKASQTSRNHGHWQVTKSGHSSRSCAKPNNSKDYGSKYH